MAADKKMYQSKTVWAGIVAIIGAVAGYFTGEIQASAAIQIVVTALMGIFLRDGMRKRKNG